MPPVDELAPRLSPTMGVGRKGGSSPPVCFVDASAESGPRRRRGILLQLRPNVMGYGVTNDVLMENSLVTGVSKLPVVVCTDGAGGW